MSRWKFAKRTFCITYLIFFTVCELYSAAATALDHRRDYPTWEPLVGRWLFVAPGLLAAGLFLAFTGEKSIAFWMMMTSLGLYVTFFVFEQVSYSGHQPNPAISWVNALWLALFSLAVWSALWLRGDDQG